MTIKNDFNIGDTVYLECDDEQKPRKVIAIMVSPGALLYTLVNGTDISDHYTFEIIRERNMLTKLNAE